LPNYFFDTSALAKVYRQEVGSAFLDRILSEPASRHIISRLTVVEMESGLALKARIGEIDRQAVSIARRRIDADLARRRLLIAAVNGEHFPGAGELLVKHGATHSRRVTTLGRACAQASRTCNGVRRSRSETLPSGSPGRVRRHEPRATSFDRHLRELCTGSRAISPNRSIDALPLFAGPRTLA
jgi:uncharacterized protein with PIN domain